MKKQEWEDISPIDYAQTIRRQKVPWGWLVVVVDEVMHTSTERGREWGQDWRTSITFVFDPFHWWEVK